MAKKIKNTVIWSIVIILFSITIYNVRFQYKYTNKIYLNSIITLQTGDDCQNYRFINFLDSNAILTSIIKTYEDEKFYEISFRQYCNHDSYDFKFKVTKGDYINAYFCKKPFGVKENKCELLIYEVNDKYLKLKLKREK